MFFIDVELAITIFILSQTYNLVIAGLVTGLVLPNLDSELPWKSMETIAIPL